MQTHTDPSGTAPSSSPGSLLRPKDVARRLNISIRTFERLLSAGKFFRPDLRIGRLTLWKPETVGRWIDDESARQRGRGA